MELFDFLSRDDIFEFMLTPNFTWAGGDPNPDTPVVVFKSSPSVKPQARDPEMKRKRSYI